MRLTQLPFQDTAVAKRTVATSTVFAVLLLTCFQMQSRAQLSNVSESLHLQAGSGPFNNFPAGSNNTLDLTGIGFPATGAAAVAGGAASLSAGYSFISANTSADFQVNASENIPSDQFPLHSTNVAGVNLQLEGSFTLSSATTYTATGSYDVTDRFETQPFLSMSLQDAGSTLFQYSVPLSTPDADVSVTFTGILGPGTYRYGYATTLENGVPTLGQPQASNSSNGIVKFDLLLGSQSDFIHGTPEPGPVALLLGAVFSVGLTAFRRKKTGTVGRQLRALLRRM